MYDCTPVIASTSELASDKLDWFIQSSLQRRLEVCEFGESRAVDSEESGLYYAGDYQLRHRTPGADVDVCFGGRIAVTAVRLL